MLKACCSHAEVRVEPHRKKLRVTLAYNFPSTHLPSLEKLARGIEVQLGCDWLVVLLSRDIRCANHEVNGSSERCSSKGSGRKVVAPPQTLRVVYPYTPQNQDELELALGDHIFVSPADQGGTSEGWLSGTSLASGQSGLLPQNYVSGADECDTWVFHG